MYPEKGPIFAKSPARLKIKWPELLVMSEIFRLVGQRFYFDAGDLAWQALGLRENRVSTDSSVSVRKRLTSAALFKGLCLLGDVAVGGYFVIWMTENNGKLCTGLLASCLEILRVRLSSFF
jgi:hypothetical protein